MMLANKPANCGGKIAFGAKISQLTQTVKPQTTDKRPPKEFAFYQYTPNARVTKAATKVTL